MGKVVIVAQKYIKEQYDESKEEDGTAFERQQVTVPATPAFQACKY